MHEETKPLMSLIGALRLSTRGAKYTKRRFSELIRENSSVFRHYFGVDLLPGSLNIDVSTPTSVAARPRCRLATANPRHSENRADQHAGLYRRGPSVVLPVARRCRAGESAVSAHACRQALLRSLRRPSSATFTTSSMGMWLQSTFCRRRG